MTERDKKTAHLLEEAQKLTKYSVLLSDGDDITQMLLRGHSTEMMSLLALCISEIARRAQTTPAVICGRLTAMAIDVGKMVDSAKAAGAVTVTEKPVEGDSE